MKKIMIFIALIAIITLFAGCNETDFTELQITEENGIQHVVHNNVKFRIDDNKAIIVDIDQFEEIYIPEKIGSYLVTDIDESCRFGYLSEERSLTVDTKNQYFYDDGKALYSGDKTKLYYVYNRWDGKQSSYTLPEDVKWIHKNAFKTSDVNVTVDPNNRCFCTYNDALYDYSVKRLIYCFSDGGVLNIPDSVEEIEEAVLDCYDISEFNVDSENKFFASNNGILFKYDMKELVRCPMGADVPYCIVPEGTVTIGNGAFCNCNNINLVYLPDSVLEIHDNAFAQCNDLFKISLPKALSFIGKNILDESGPTNSSTNVIYRGTDEDWAKIKFADDSIQKWRVTTMNDTAYEKINDFKNLQSS